MKNLVYDGFLSKSEDERKKDLEAKEQEVVKRIQA